MNSRQQSKRSTAGILPKCKGDLRVFGLTLVAFTVLLLNQPGIAQSSMTNRFYYDHSDRLVGAEYSQGVSIAYQYDGNGNLFRQTVLSRASETNGLPVLWQFLNGLTNGTAADGPWADADGDGWSNYAEWLAGTDPNNPNSRPDLLGNPGTNIASLAVPFTPSNFVAATGQLNGVAVDEIFVGADGNASGTTNSLFILTQGPSSWQVQSLPVGPLAITSIAVGQPTNGPMPAIYVGLRQTGGTGAIWELIQTNGLWQTNVLAVSTNEAAYVLGVRAADVLASFATNGLDNTLYSLTYSNGVWSQTIISTNGSQRGLGTHGEVFAQHNVDSSLRLLDMGGIEVVGGNSQLYTDNILLPQGMIQDTNAGKWYFETPTAMTYSAASNYFAGFDGKLSFPLTGDENDFLSAHFRASSWVGLYWSAAPNEGCGGGPYDVPFYGDGSAAPNCCRNGGCSAQYNGPYQNWFEPDEYSWVGPCTVFNYSSPGDWGCIDGDNLYPGIGEPLNQVLIYTNQWLIPEASATNRFPWRGLSLAVGSPHPDQTNSTSIFYAFADDLNLSGHLDAGDDFTLAEYLVSGNTWTTNTLLDVPIISSVVAQSFSLATVNFTGTGNDTLFTGEPDGRVYFWTATNSTNAMERQLFSDAYVGKAWQAMCSVQSAGVGNGLVGVMVDPANQNTCNIIFWQPQATISAEIPFPETAPVTSVLPGTNVLAAPAAVPIEIWDALGNSSTPYVQYEFVGATNWQNATILSVDGNIYNSNLRVPATPTGVSHTLTWDSFGDLGQVQTNVMLRAQAMDVALLGAWSAPVTYAVNTLPPFQISSGSTNLQLTTNGFQFQISGLDGSGPIIVYASTNLLDWIPISTNPAFDGTLPFIDPAATNLPRRFYKATEQ